MSEIIIWFPPYTGVALYLVAILLVVFLIAKELVESS